MVSCYTRLLKLLKLLELLELAARNHAMQECELEGLLLRCQQQVPPTVPHLINSLHKEGYQCPQG